MMPTGYTFGIIDGKITTFPQFAKQCMRAFGATIHMRDEDANVEYTPRVPSDYHDKEIEKYNQELENAKSLSDDEIVSLGKSKLEKDRDYYLNKIAETKAARIRLDNMLNETKKYIPPTSEHTGIKDFMIQQIQTTIDHDGDTNYYDNRLKEITESLSKLNADDLRHEMIADAHKNLAYHTKERGEELKRCNDSNKWVEDFINSLPQ